MIALADQGERTGDLRVHYWDVNRSERCKAEHGARCIANRQFPSDGYAETIPSRPIVSLCQLRADEDREIFQTALRATGLDWAHRWRREAGLIVTVSQSVLFPHQIN
jgi:hypothetical protein